MKYDKIEIDFYEDFDGFMDYISTKEFSGTKTQIRQQVRAYSKDLRKKHPRCRIRRFCAHKDFQDLAPQLRLYS